jgi:hypothetical protein
MVTGTLNQDRLGSADTFGDDDAHCPLAAAAISAMV